jgi:hypothetical protein
VTRLGKRLACDLARLSACGAHRYTARVPTHPGLGPSRCGKKEFGMSIEGVDFQGWIARAARAGGVTLLLATTAAAHEGHVIGTGIGATLVHALQHGLGVLVIGVAAMAVVRSRRERRRAARVVARRGDFS